MIAWVGLPPFETILGHLALLVGSSNCGGQLLLPFATIIPQKIKAELLGRTRVTCFWELLIAT